MKFSIRIIIVMLALATITLFLGGCEGEKGPAGPEGPPGPPALANATCLSSSCHGDTAARKIIVNDLGQNEIVPLYVDSTRYVSSTHGSKLCVSCHTDINAAGGAHGDVFKVYGGWARFSRKQAVETISINEIARTRNYSTAASYSCISCHKSKAGFMSSAHATIFKHREAKVDAELSTLCGRTVGEDYAAGDCNRCHATCATCHFKSSISRLSATGSALDYWDQLQANYPNVPDWNDKMTEFQMDWTTNVASHEFRRADYFATDSDKVCEACHTGYQKPAAWAFYWLDAEHTAWDSIKATNVKRHPQTYDLIISGASSYQSGGTNTAHAGMKCNGCHGSKKGDIHSLPGLEYKWSEGGDVQCTDCHPSPNHTATVAQHYDGTGTKVSCIGCHTFGLARDFDPASGGHDVFLDPVTNEVRPVVNKHTGVEAWYAHNWQTLNPGTSMTDPNGDCAKKCHYVGNKIGAPAS